MPQSRIDELRQMLALAERYESDSAAAHATLMDHPVNKRIDSIDTERMGLENMIRESPVRTLADVATKF